MEKSNEFNDEHVPSFFQNSGLGISATEVQIQEVFAEKGDECSIWPNVNVENEVGRKEERAVGGFTCCVPECFRNSTGKPD